MKPSGDSHLVSYFAGSLILLDIRAAAVEVWEDTVVLFFWDEWTWIMMVNVASQLDLTLAGKRKGLKLQAGG